MGTSVGGAAPAPAPAPTAPPPTIQNTPVNNLPPGFTRPAAPGRQSSLRGPWRTATVLLTAMTASVFGMVFARRRKPR
jgi:hypothetical protein